MKYKVMNDPLDLLNKLVEQVRPKYIIALFSGGHDSTVATHIASRHPAFSFACHLDTGIGVPQTRDFVSQTCNEWGVELKIYRAADYVRANGTPDPQIYEEMVCEHGFPGPAFHKRMYNSLKERPLRMMLRELERGRHDRVMLVSGIRRAESVRRMRHVEPLQQWEGTKFWAAPIWQFTKVDVGEYMQTSLLKRNEVVDSLHKSGECLCGAYAKKGELDELAFWFPDVANQIKELETKVKARGFPWGWEACPPKWWGGVKSGQLFLPGLDLMCTSCERTFQDGHFRMDKKRRNDGH